MRTLLVIAGLALAAALLHPLEPSVAPATRPPAGTIAFSSLAPRGWDLYVTDVETHQTHRLTDHPALDYNAAAAPRVGRQAEGPARSAGGLGAESSQHPGFSTLSRSGIPQLRQLCCWFVSASKLD